MHIPDQVPIYLQSGEIRQTENETMIIILFLLLFDITTTRTIQNRYLLNEEALRELEDWELKLLKDFVRGKGHGSVSRLPIDLLLSEKEPSLDEEPPLLDINDPNVVPLGGVYFDKAPQPKGPTSFIVPTSIIAPASYIPTFDTKRRPKIQYKTTKYPLDGSSSGGSNLVRPRTSSKRQHYEETKSKKKTNAQRASKTVEDQPSSSSFKELAGLFQSFIDRRKSYSSHSKKPFEPPPKEHNAQSTSAIGQWEPMEPSEKTLESEEIEVTSEPSKEDWEHKMRELSEQLSSILMQIKHAKDKRPVRNQVVTKPPKPPPKLTILRNGSAEQSQDGGYIFIATLTLIKDEGRNILVDTGLGTDINGRTLLLSKLDDVGLAPPNIDIVVTTHGHPDHSGGTHDFPDATHYQGWYQHQATHFNLSGLFESDRHQLTSNVHLIRCAGHSSEDIAVVVKGEQSMGTVVVAGDTFLRKEDIDYPMMWQPLSANEDQQSEVRRRLICSGANWIVPGHGPPFAVDSNIRKKFRC